MASAGKNQNQQQGESIEQYRARQRGSDASHTPDEWFDVIDGWTPIEVKSTTRRLASGRRGRWRLWKSQHEKLLEQEGEYDLAVIEDDDLVAEKTLSAKEMDEVINEANLSWTSAGDSHSMPSQQVKIPWNYVFDNLKQ